MQRLIVTTFILLCLCLRVAGQASSDKPLSVIVKLHPVELVDLIMPTVMASVEVKYHQLAVQLGYGTTYSTTMKDDYDKEYYIKGSRYKVEFRHYWLNKKRFRLYGGVNFFKTIYDKELGSFEYRNHASGQTYRFSSGIIHKKVHGVTYKGGIVLRMGKRFAFEAAPEMGIRTVTARFYNQKDLETIITRPTRHYDYEFKREGTLIKPHAYISVSINYRLL